MWYLIRFLTLALTALVALGLSAPAGHAAPSDTGQWATTTTMPFFPVHTHQLPTGKAMVWPGDEGISGNDPRSWDPATQSISALTKPGYDVFCAGHTFLADSRLFVAGGHIQNLIGLAKTSIYDSLSDTWTALPNMNAGRWYPTTTVLANGDVLVVSGYADLTLGENTLPQVFQVATNSWRSLTNAQKFLDLYPRMFLAPNGQVFNAAPLVGTYYLDTSGTGSWTYVADRAAGYRDYGSAVMYQPGKILVMGGGDPPTNAAEVIDLNAGSPRWRSVAPMQFARRQNNAVLLPDGQVLVTGGTSGSGFNNANTPVFAAELWNPATETWATMASASNLYKRLYHSSTILLPDGRVFSTGGNGYPQSELYSPPYLFKGARPTITSAPASVDYGQTFFVGTPDAPNITKIRMLRLSSTTHAFDESQYINDLGFSQAAGGLDVVAPRAPVGTTPPVVAPRGPYLLFLLNGNGVPSVGKFVRLGAAGSGGTVTVTRPANQTSTVGTPASLQINATATPAGTQTYSATGLPAGLSINAGTGLISGTPTTAGTSTVNVTVTSTNGGSGNTSFSWTVNPVGGGSTNLALGKNAVASSVEGAAFPASAAVDGSAATRWSSLFADPQWIYVDLQATYNIDRVQLSWEAAYSNNFRVEVSPDAANWTTIYSTTTGTGGTQNLTGLSGTGRYVRVYCVTRATPWGDSLYEFEVYGTAAGGGSGSVTVTQPASQTSTVGTPASLQINATATPAGTQTYSATGLPAGLSINAGTGLISGTPTTAGTSTVNVTVTSTNGGSGNTSFSWTVNPAGGGSTNLALGKNAVASSVEGAAFPAGAAVDGSAATRWSSLFADPQWIYVDLGASYNLSRVKLTWEAAFGSSYQVQTSSDAANWTTIRTVTGGDGGVDDLTGLSGTGRYVRIYGTVRGTPWGYSLYEFEVYGTAAGGGSGTVTVTQPASQTSTVGTPASLQINATATPAGTQTYGATGLPAGLSINAGTGLISGTPTTAGTSTVNVTVTSTNGGSGNTSFSWTVNPAGGGSTNLALGRPSSAYTASSTEGTAYAAARAFDGNAATRWSSQFSDPQWVKVDLGATYNITGVKLVWEAAYASSYKIQVSTNNSTWTDLYSTTTGTGGTVTPSVTGVGRYVRMYGTGRGTPWGYSLWEFEVYGTP